MRTCKATVAHEFGHIVLEAVGSRILSWGHKGTSELWQTTSSAATPFAASGEIDLMRYYTDEDLPADYPSRVVAAEEDVLRLINLSAVVVSLGDAA